jgi:hypothetical protein
MKIFRLVGLQSLAAAVVLSIAPASAAQTFESAYGEASGAEWPDEVLPVQHCPDEGSIAVE